MNINDSSQKSFLSLDEVILYLPYHSRLYLQVYVHGVSIFIQWQRNVESMKDTRYRAKQSIEGEITARANSVSSLLSSHI